MSSEKLCKSCGLCCDGTLYAHVLLTPKDDEKLFITSCFPDPRDINGHKILHPCNYYQNKICEIYDQRPEKCVTYKCKLLKQYEKNELSFEQAISLILSTTDYADRIRKQLCEMGSASIGHLASLYSAWVRTEKDAGSPDWRRKHNSFILEYLALSLRLDRYFRKEKNRVTSKKLM